MNLPPVIQILLNENLTELQSPANWKKFLKRILPELRQQANWTKENFLYLEDEERRTKSELVITASGSLSPLSNLGRCETLNCRINHASHFARTAGLYADVVAIPDTITSVLAFKENMSASEVSTFINDILVLKNLEPLINAGIIRFRRGFLRGCKECIKEAEEQIKHAVSELMPELLSELQLLKIEDSLFIDTGKLSDVLIEISPETVKHETALGKSENEIFVKSFEDSLLHQLFNTLGDLKSAESLGSSLFSTSRLDLIAVRALDLDVPPIGIIEEWENERTVELPFVEKLSAEQIIQLRNEANKALPLFREKMRRAFFSDEEKTPSNTIAELREDAEELAAELKALDVSGENRFRNIYGSVGLAVSIYGFGSGIMPPSVIFPGLMTMLGYLHKSAHDVAQELEKLQSRPSYVLLKAKEITESDHSH